MGLRHLAEAGRRWGHRAAPLVARRCGSRRGLCGTGGASATPWTRELDDDEFGRLRRVLEAPSPVGLESALVEAVKRELLQGSVPSSWKLHRFRGHAGAVLDTAPEAPPGTLTLMVMGHADKIRMQVKKVASDGKVYIDCDSHLPLTLLGNPVVIFSELADSPGQYRAIRGGTVEALGAIHFADPSVRSGAKGIKPEQLYVELQIHGERAKDQVVEGLGLRPGDSILMDRPIQRGVGANTFQGAYLDNGLGCYITAKVAQMVAAAAGAGSSTLTRDARVLFAFSSHEEIGRFGSRVLAAQFRPDVLFAVDVNHDYKAAPGVGSKQFPDIAMGGGPTLAVGSIVSPLLNATVQRAARARGIPLQLDVVGRDTGTDAMASVLASIDCAATSIGVPIRNMHTISETACSNDVLAAAHLVHAALEELAVESASGQPFAHPDLAGATTVRSVPALAVSDKPKSAEGATG